MEQYDPALDAVREAVTKISESSHPVPAAVITTATEKFVAANDMQMSGLLLYEFFENCGLDHILSGVYLLTNIFKQLPPPRPKQFEEIAIQCFQVVLNHAEKLSADTLGKIVKVLGIWRKYEYLSAEILATFTSALEVALKRQEGVIAALGGKPSSPSKPTHPPHPPIIHPAHPPAPAWGGDGDEVFTTGGAGWNAQYICTSAAFADRRDLEFGDKIILPPSALAEMTNRKIEFPMIFQIRNPADNKLTYCGVLEFGGAEGRCVVPAWVMRNIALEEGRRVHLRYVSLPKGTYAKLRPVRPDLLDSVANPKALLETLLRHFATLVKGQSLCIANEFHELDFEVVDIEPAGKNAAAVCIIDTEIAVDFEGISKAKPNPTTSSSTSTSLTGEKKVEEGRSWSQADTNVSSSSAAANLKDCKNCGGKIPADKWALHEAVCLRNNFLCPKCGKRMKVSDKAQHSIDFHSLVSCPASCGAQVEKYLMDLHLKDQCPMRAVTCQFCELPIQAKVHVEHERYCGSRTEKCPECKKFIKLMDLNVHNAYKCNPPAPPKEVIGLSKREALKASLLVCPHCLEGFQEFEEFEAHLLRKHGKSL